MVCMVITGRRDFGGYFVRSSDRRIRQEEPAVRPNLWCRCVYCRSSSL